MRSLFAALLPIALIGCISSGPNESRDGKYKRQVEPGSQDFDHFVEISGLEWTEYSVNADGQRSRTAQGRIDMAGDSLRITLLRIPDEGGGTATKPCTENQVCFQGTYLAQNDSLYQVLKYDNTPTTSPRIFLRVE